MDVTIVNQRTDTLIHTLTDLWERSVTDTHLFLTPSEINAIKRYVPEALRNVAHLVIAINENEQITAFMGIEGTKLEMLFVDPNERGKGIGKCLIRFGIDHYFLNEVTVNEQNPQAIGFYEHMGFHIYKRTDHDEQGGPYPLYYMKFYQRIASHADQSEME